MFYKSEFQNTVEIKTAIAKQRSFGKNKKQTKIIDNRYGLTNIAMGKRMFLSEKHVIEIGKSFHFFLYLIKRIFHSFMHITRIRIRIINDSDD